MNKPIEPGCLAVVVGNPACSCAGCHTNAGKKVVVVACVGLMLIDDGLVWAWEVTSVGPPLIVLNPATGEESTQMTGVVPEPWLQRLDDPQGADETLVWAGKPREVVPC